VEEEKKGKSKVPWSYTWNCIRLGACEMMLGNQEKAKVLFQATANSKSKDKWSQNIIRQANKFISTGGHFAMLEITVLTGHFEKSLKNTTDTRKKEILDIVEKVATKAPGALVKPTGPDHKAAKNLNDPKIDNRVAYLVIKSLVLRALEKKEDCMACLLEVIMLKEQLVDKLYYALALLQLGRVISRDAPDEAKIHFETVMKVNNIAWENQIKMRVRGYLKKLGVDEKDVVVEEDDKETEKYIESQDLQALIKAEEEDEQ